MSQPQRQLSDQIEALGSEDRAALESFLEFLVFRSESRRLTHAAAKTSEPTFAAVWDNREDDVYDGV
jgi:hypothetical protein